MQPPADLFGVRASLRREDALQLVEDLRRLAKTSDGTTRSLADDLKTLSTVFDPLAREATVRDRLTRVAHSTQLSSRLAKAPLVAGEGDWIVLTPEGRIILDVLSDALESDAGPVIIIDSDIAYAAEHLAYETYRRLSTTRLTSVLAALTEKAGALRIPGVAAILILLVNNSVDEHTAIKSPPNVVDRRRLDDALSAIGTAFWNAVDPIDHSSEAFAISSGYAWTEARRRFPRIVFLAPMYIPRDQRDAAVAAVADELSRRARFVSAPIALRAFDALVRGYRSQVPVLAGLGFAHEQTQETRRMRDRLEGLLAERARRP